MKFKRIVLFSVFFASLLTIVSCATMDIHQDNSVINREFNKLAKWVEKNTNYDPYGNEIHINSQEFRARFNEMIQNINHYSSVQFFSINTYISHCISYDDDWRCVKRDEAITKSQIGERWQRRALAKFRENGFVVTQKGIPEGNLNFGSYSIPVQLTVGIIGTDSVTANLAIRKHNFTIKKHVSVPQNQPSANTTSPKQESTVAEKIRLLKKMKDEGLITPDEFENKKSKLIDEL